MMVFVSNIVKHSLRMIDLTSTAEPVRAIYAALHRKTGAILGVHLLLH